MADENELRACPFCASNDTGIIPTAMSEYYAACNNCGANGGIFSDREESVEAWNHASEAVAVYVRDWY